MGKTAKEPREEKKRHVHFIWRRLPPLPISPDRKDEGNEERVCWHVQTILWFHIQYPLNSARSFSSISRRSLAPLSAQTILSQQPYISRLSIDDGVFDSVCLSPLPFLPLFHHSFASHPHSPSHLCTFLFPSFSHLSLCFSDDLPS